MKPKILEVSRSKLRLAYFCRFCITVSMFSIAASCASDAEEHSYTTAENLLYFDELSEENFGVSLVALAWLANWQPHSYIPLSYLERSGKNNVLKELEQAGLIEIQKRKGLPDGTESDVTQVRVVPIGRGLKIVAGFDVLLQDLVDHGG